MDRCFRSRNGTGAILFLALLSCTGAACATSQSAGAAEGAAKAHASLDFRIVIPETVRIDAIAPSADPPRIFVSRTERLEAGRRVVTVAKP